MSQTNRLSAVLAKKGIFVDRLIGEGRFGSAYEIKTSHGIQRKSTLAAKVFDLDRLSMAYATDKIDLEIKTHEELDHENVIRLHSVIRTNSFIVLILDLADKTLKDVIRDGPMSDSVVWSVFQQCISGLRYLHGIHIAHRDLKPENILMKYGAGFSSESAGFRVKISDFGMTLKCVDSQTKQKVLALDFCGSPGYAAPEIWLKQPYDAITADVWSLGVIFYEVLTLELPTMPLSKGKCSQCLKCSSPHNADLMKLTLSLLEEDVNKRPQSANEILINSIDIK